MITNKEIEKWVDDSIRYTVECIYRISEEKRLNPFKRENYGQFYKYLHGHVNVDVPLITTILKNWIFMKAKYQDDFGKPILMIKI